MSDFEESVFNAQDKPRTRPEPDAWLYDSVTYTMMGREKPSKMAKVERQNPEKWPGEQPLFTVETIIEVIEEWQGKPDPTGDREVNKAAVKLAEELKEVFGQ